MLTVNKNNKILCAWTYTRFIGGTRWTYKHFLGSMPSHVQAPLPIAIPTASFAWCGPWLERRPKWSAKANIAIAGLHLNRGSLPPNLTGMRR